MVAVDELGERLARTLGDSYALEGEVGRGGMGIVYRARDRRLKRAVAVKVLPPDLAFRSDVRSRFLREAETAAQLSHPHIVPIYSVDERDGIVYFIMAYVDGDTLGARLAPCLPMAVADARRIGREVADALAYAHARGVIHRDIKPDNILLSREGMQAMVTDFGIARALTTGAGTGSDTRLTATGVAIGTPAYMSPEQCAGDRGVDGRSDLYSLGVVLYQMLCGYPPFTGANTAGMLVKQLTERPIPLRERNPSVPPQLGDAVMCLLEKDPARRLQSATAVVAALDGAIVPPPRGASPFPPPVVVAAPAANAPAYVPRADVEAVLLERRIRKFQGQIGSYAAISLGLLALNMATGWHSQWWFWAPVGMSFALFSKAAKLFSDGVPLSLAFGPFWPGRWHFLRRGRRAAAAELPPAPKRVAGATQTELRATRLVSREVLDGPYGTVVRRAVADQLSILHLYDALDKGERALVPDVVKTANALIDQVALIAGALHRLDAAAPAEQPDSLTDRRKPLAAQLDRACLALEALALDLIRLRSAGLSVTQAGGSATEQARAVLLDIDYVLQAASELRASDQRGAPVASEVTGHRVLNSGE